MVVSAEAQNAAEAVEAVRRLEIDLVILDIALPDKNGLEVLEFLKREYPAVRVLVLSMYSEDQYAVQAFRKDADGYLTKQSAPEELIRAVGKISAGGKYVSSSLAERLVLDLGKAPGMLPHEALSGRELQVMAMIAGGSSPKEIADKLCLSVKTVGTYRERIMEKMNLKSNAGIIRYAIENDLVE